MKPESNLMFGLVLIMISFIYHQFNSTLDGPYMDEIFHISQTKEYCKGNWLTYDPKLTTPPGLYIVSYVMIYFLSWLKRVEMKEICYSSIQRSTNMLFCVGLYWILKEIIQFKRGHQSAANSSKALLLLLFPPAFFFHFLYYTDSGSMTLVLWSYLLSLKKQYLLSSLVSVVLLLL